jgi:hypothetical protein
MFGANTTVLRLSLVIVLCVVAAVNISAAVLLQMLGRGD